MFDDACMLSVGHISRIELFASHKTSIEAMSVNTDHVADFHDVCS